MKKVKEDVCVFKPEAGSRFLEKPGAKVQKKQRLLRGHCHELCYFMVFFNKSVSPYPEANS